MNVLHDNFPDLAAFETSLNHHSTYAIGPWGGRTFLLKNANGEQISCKMQTLVQYFEKLVIKNKADFKYHLSSILSVKYCIAILDREGELDLAGMGFKLRFLTFLRRIFHIFKKSHFTSLNRIIDDHLPLTTNDKVYNEFRSLMNENHDLVTKMAEIGKKIIIENQEMSAEDEQVYKQIQFLKSFYDSCGKSDFEFWKYLVRFQNDYPSTTKMLTLMDALRSNSYYSMDLITRNVSMTDQLVKSIRSK